MPYKEFEDNLKQFVDLIKQLKESDDKPTKRFILRYLDQNVSILNEMVTTSIDNLLKLQKAKTVNEVVCIQAKFTNEINNKVVVSAQRFLNASLGNIADYNEWLKAHCDLATD